MKVLYTKLGLLGTHLSGVKIVFLFFSTFQNRCSDMSLFQLFLTNWPDVMSILCFLDWIVLLSIIWNYLRLFFCCFQLKNCGNSIFALLEQYDRKLYWWNRLKGPLKPQFCKIYQIVCFNLPFKFCLNIKSQNTICFQTKCYCISASKSAVAS
jgi:hypothetical protein